MPIVCHKKKLCNADGNASRRYYLMSHNTVSTEEVGAVEAPGKTKILIWKILDILIVFFGRVLGYGATLGGFGISEGDIQMFHRLDDSSPRSTASSPT